MPRINDACLKEKTKNMKRKIIPFFFWAGILLGLTPAFVHAFAGDPLIF